MNISKRKLGIVGVSLVLAATTVSLVTFSWAKYIESKSVGQEVSRNGIENTSLFFNANIWNQGKDSSGNIVDAVYYLWIADANVLITPTRHVTPTVNDTVMDLFVFEHKYAWKEDARDLVFIRANPSVSITSFSTWPTEAVWNQTCNIPYNAQRNYYCIKGWSGATDGKSEYEYNRIDKAGSTLSWGNPAGSSTTIYS